MLIHEVGVTLKPVDINSISDDGPTSDGLSIWGGLPGPTWLARTGAKVGRLLAEEEWLPLAPDCQNPSLAAYAAGGHSGEQRVCMVREAFIAVFF